MLQCSIFGVLYVSHHKDQDLPNPFQGAISWFTTPLIAKGPIKVPPLSTSIRAEVRRLGFMEGYVSVPEDLDRMGQEEIEARFGGGA